jgi:hypothetical protein
MPMNLIEDLRRTIIEGSSDLATALRKAKVLATHLGTTELKEWVDHELNGYPANVDVPEYRRIHTPAFGHFSGPFGREARNVALPTSIIPDNLRSTTVDLAFRHNLRQLQGMLATKNPRYRWTAEAIMFMRERVGTTDGSELVDAYSALPAGALEGILDAVRNRMLDFLLELQAIDPKILKTDEALSDLPKEQVRQVFNVTIQGDRNVFAAGHGVSQAITEVAAHDQNTLMAYLASKGLNREDLDKLTSALESDGSPSRGTLGPRVRAWITTMLGKALDGSWKVAVDTAAVLLPEALKRYHGWG